MNQVSQRQWAGGNACVYAHYDLVLRFERLLDVLGDGRQLGRSRVVVQLLDEPPRLKARRLLKGRKIAMVGRPRECGQRNKTNQMVSTLAASVLWAM